MRTLNRLMFARLLAFTPLVTMAADDDAPSGEPDITIRQKGDKTIQEHCVSGFLYAIKVVPKYDKPYFLVCTDDGDDDFIRSDQPGKLTPRWEIFS